MEEPILTNRELLRDMHNKVNEMHSEVFGNEKANRLGYGQRLSKLEEADKHRGKTYTLITALSAGLSIGFYKAIEFFNK